MSKLKEYMKQKKIIKLQRRHKSSFKLSKSHSNSSAMKQGGKFINQGMDNSQAEVKYARENLRSMYEAYKAKKPNYKESFDYWSEQLVAQLRAQGHL